MVNVTVVKGRDVIKYLVRIIVTIILIFILARFFYRFKETKSTTDVKEESTEALISCLEETIPQAKSAKKDESEIEEENEPVKTVLTKELGMINAMTKKELEVQKLVNEESSITLENNDQDENNDQNENNNPNDIRRSSAS